MDNQNYEKQLHIIMKIIKPDNMMWKSKLYHISVLPCHI